MEAGDGIERVDLLVDGRTDGRTDRPTQPFLPPEKHPPDQNPNQPKHPTKYKTQQTGLPGRPGDAAGGLPPHRLAPRAPETGPLGACVDARVDACMHACIYACTPDSMDRSYVYTHNISYQHNTPTQHPNTTPTTPDDGGHGLLSPARRAVRNSAHQGRQAGREGLPHRHAGARLCMYVCMYECMSCLAI